MKLMFKEEGGFNNFSDSEAEKAAKEGWVDGEPIRQKLMDAKRKPVQVPEIEAIITPPAAPRRGRPPKGKFGKE